MKTLLAKFAGDGAALPARAPRTAVALAWLGSFLAIGAVALLTRAVAHPLVLGSFGASCVILFGFPDIPFAQPRNAIGGHFLSALVGLFFLHFVGPHWWSLAAAVGTAVSLMLLTRTVHPPAGSNPVIVFLGQSGWTFLAFPTLLGSLAIVAVALVYNNATREARYPKYWW